VSSLGFLSKNWVLISAVFLTTMAYDTELQAQSASVRLTWTDTSDNEDGFKVERLMAGLVDATVTIAPNASSYTDPGLVLGAIYCYRVRAFNSAGDSDTSNQVCANAQGGGNSTPATITVSPTSVAASAKVTASWSGISNPSSTDWIGLYAPGTADYNPANYNFIEWTYVNCTTSRSNGTGASSGSCPLVIPSTLSAGTYELRLFANDGYERLATSAPFAVSTAGVGQPSLTANPTNVAPSGTVSAIWAGIASPTSLDWIGLYAPGTPDYGSANYNFIEWTYVNCTTSRSNGSGASSGSCPFVISSTLSAGTYELRLFADDGYTRLAKSRAITVASTPSFALASTSTRGSGIRPVSQVQNSALAPLTTKPPLADGNYTAQKWSNYRLMVKLQSMDNGTIGVIVRYQDPSNYYRFSWNRELSVRRLEIVENGVLTVLREDAVPHVSGQTYNLEITVQDATITVGIDDVLVFSVTDSTFMDGTIGLYSARNQGIFDDVLVQDLATGAVLLSEDFNNGSFSGWTIVDDVAENGPSLWSAQTGALVQSSNIGSTNDLGTYALY